MSNTAGAQAASTANAQINSGVNSTLPYYDQGNTTAQGYYTTGQNTANSQYGLSALATNTGQQTAQNYYGTGQQQLASGTQGAVNYLDNGYTGAENTVGTGAQTGINSIQSGTDAGTGYLNNTAGMYGSLYNNYGSGADMYANALGLNGAAGTQAAQSAFTTSPGYNWEVGQGLDAVSRASAAGGSAASGNTYVDALKYAQGQASQEYNNWLSNLSGYNGLQLSAASGVAGANQGLSNLSYNSGVAQGDMSYNAANTQAQLAAAAANTGSNYLNQYGINAATLSGQQAQSASNAANSLSSLYQTQAAATGQTAANQANAAYNTYANEGNTVYNANNTQASNTVSGAVADQKANSQDKANTYSLIGNSLSGLSSLAGGALGAANKSSTSINIS